MNLLLLGNHGQLGRAFEGELQNRNAVFKAFSRQELDVTDEESLCDALATNRPTVVINCAAYTNVAQAEHDSKQALSVNALALKSLAGLCAAIDCQLVHFSTDYVFDGKKRTPYTESDPPNPLNEYGRSKRLGETYILESNVRTLLLRTSWVYGEGPNNFVSKLIQWGAQQSTLRVVHDEVSVPTSAIDLARITMEALEQGVSGVFHLVNSGTASRYEWAQAVKESLPSLCSHIEPALSSEFSSHLERPLYSALDNRRLCKRLGLDIRPWQSALEEALPVIRRSLKEMRST